MSHFSDEARAILSSFMSQFEALLGGCISKAAECVEPIVEESLDSLVDTACKVVHDATREASEAVQDAIEHVSESLEGH